MIAHILKDKHLVVGVINSLNLLVCWVFVVGTELFEQPKQISNKVSTGLKST